MPSVLALSLWRPAFRYGLILPSSLVVLPLLSICAVWLPSGIAGLGWLVLTGGVMLGSGLGLWFWYPWIPVPHELSDPFSFWRLRLIGWHVGMTVSGMVILTVTVAAIS